MLFKGTSDLSNKSPMVVFTAHAELTSVLTTFNREIFCHQYIFFFPVKYGILCCSYPRPQTAGVVAQA